MPADLTVHSNPGIAWAESLGKAPSENTSDFRAGHTGCSASLVLEFNGYEMAEIQGIVLGYPQSARDKDGYRRLTRTPPMRHPRYPWMYASEITFMHPAGFVGTSVNDYGKISEWERVIVGVVFRPPLYQIKSDDDILYEFERFVEIKTEPKIQSISLDRQERVWVHDTGRTYKGHVAYVLSKKSIKLIWHQVPEFFIGDRWNVAPNIEGVIGRINDAVFLGYATGTLLCGSVEIERIPWYIPPTTINPGEAETEISSVLRITFNLEHFDPPPGGANRGHNLAIDPDDSTWKWYLHKSKNGQPLFTDANFYDLFAGAS
jgi:hypothetical protein